jgi:pimeloyl-ACP methyl ester carboxylesterase
MIWLAVIVAAVLIAAFVTAEILVHPWMAGNRRSEPFPADRDWPHEDVFAKAADGTVTRGWFIPHAESRGLTVVILHGINDNRTGMLGRAGMVRERLKANVCLMDLRAHGLSEGSACGYGLTERDDLAALVTVLSARKDVAPGRIVVMGVSLGGSVAMMSAAADPRIAAVVAESAYSTLSRAVTERSDRLGVPRGFMRLVRAFFERRAGWSWDEVDVRAAVAKSACPLLLIHGAEDDESDPGHSQNLYDSSAAKLKRLWIVPRADHFERNPFLTAPDEYAKRLAEFLAEALP